MPGDAWRDLQTRAAPNVFLDPDALAAIAETGFADTITLSAHVDETLVGVWALEVKKMTPFGPAILAAPAYDYAFVSSPVLDRAHAGATMAAFLRTIAEAPGLPRVLRMRYLDGDTDSFRALTGASTGKPHLTLSTRERAFATRERGIKKSGSTRKKLRQLWNRLAAEGELTIDNARDARTAIDTFEAFLTMEAKGWKGKGGTALSGKRKGRPLRAADVRQPRPRRQRIGGVPAPQGPRRGDAGAALLRRHGLHLEDRLRRSTGNASRPACCSSTGSARSCSPATSRRWSPARPTAPS